MILMFVRHAESKRDRITKYGKKQCKNLRKEKEGFEFAKVYTSPANRCFKTGRVFQKKFRIELEVVEGMKERELLKTGKPQNEKEQEWYDNYMNPMFSFDSPEGCKEFLTRNFVEFKRIINHHFERNENAIIVAHSGTFYCLMAFINGIQKNKNINWYRLGTGNKVYFEINEKV
ncbi:MAG: histidine phosphatase family protein [Clostridia bacterium]|nr:histidine phosphatase family protein [Clostridia bacterium]